MPSSRPRAPWLSWLLLAVVVPGFAALWLLLALYLGRQSSWMAVVGAVDVLWVLALGRTRTAPRALLAVAATLAIAALANWGIAAAHIGSELGLPPWESMRRIGPDFTRTLALLANRWQDAVWIALALAVAAGWPALSARRPAPSAR